MPFLLPFTTIQGAFSGILCALCTSLATRNAGHNPLPAALTAALSWRLIRAMSRFARLVARLHAGRPCVPAPRASPAPRTQPRARPYHLPRSRGWLLPLLPLLPINAAVANGQLTHLLAQPEMAELIAGAPTLGRLLRPLARMLAIDLPAALQRPSRRRPPRVRPARPKPPPPDRGLPSRRPSIVVGHGKRLRRIVYGPG